MLKIKVWMRGTFEYSRDTITGPSPDQTQEEFEQNFLESDECYCSGDVYETCPYFNENGNDSIYVYIGGDNDGIGNKENPIYETSDWKNFEFEKGGGCNYIPDEPEEGFANIWWSHDMKYNQVYVWEDVNEFDPKKLKVQYGVDQKGEKYLEDLIYDGLCPDDCIDYGDTGYGYNGPDFIYHPDQKFKEEDDE